MDEIGKTNIFTHKIETEVNAKPVHKTFYRQRPELKTEVEKQTKGMLDKGIISPSSSVWNSPVVLVRKKDNTWRFAIDQGSKFPHIYSQNASQNWKMQVEILSTC